MMRPFNHDSNMRRGGGGGGGPLLTEHLRDLDLELELLKRKREMIEKQQSLLNQQQAFNLQSFSFEQPQYREFDDRPQFSGSAGDYPSAGRDFSHLYNEPTQSRGRLNRQSAKKRLGDYVWSDPPFKKSYGGPLKFPSGPSKFSTMSNKYFTGPSNKFGANSPNKFGGGPGKAFNEPSHKSKFAPPADRFNFDHSKPKPSQRFKEQERPAKPKPTDFKPTKVTKAKASEGNKVSANIPKSSLAETVAAGSSNPVLKADEAPSKQVAGRLELALGNILKVIRDKFRNDPAYKAAFADSNCSREMKQEIRERIRSVMLNKPVGNIAQIMLTYRKVYPDHTDKEIVDIGLKKKEIHRQNTSFNFVATDVVNPYIYFKKNFVRLLNVSLNKMFERIETFAKEEAEKNKPEEKVKTATKEDVTVTAEADKSGNSDVYKPEEPTVELNDSAKTEGDIINLDNDEEVSEKPTDNVETPEKSQENVEVPDKSTEDVTEKATEGEAAGKISEEEMTWRRYQIDAVRNRYERMMNEMLPQKLATWMPKLKSLIMKTLTADLSFQTARQEIISQTEAIINENKTEKEAQATPAEGKRERLKYYVKIQGRPSLPNKFIMKKYLEQFNPKIVKKMKKLRNLLFVGFDNKADFDRMVAANGDVVGTDKIIVKISNWVTSEALNAPSNETSTPNTSTLSDGDVSMAEVSGDNTELNDTLDNQIDELLTSIRNEEEGEKEKENTETIEKNENQDGAEKVEQVENEDQENQVEENEKETQEAQVEENMETNIQEPQVEENNKNVIQETQAEITKNGTQEAANQQEDKKEIDAKAEEVAEVKDKVEELKGDAKETGRATPTRASSRLANAPSTPSSIRTRRASRLAQ